MFVSQGSIRIWRVVYPSATVPAPVDPSASPSVSPAQTNRRRSTNNAGSGLFESVRGRLNSVAAPAGATLPPVALSAAPSPTTATSASASSSGIGKAIAGCVAGSLGHGYLGLENCHRLESVHDGGVTSLHTSVWDWNRMWSGDRSGRVVAWQLSSEEHWARDAEAKQCTTCDTKFSVLERRHHCRECGEYKPHARASAAGCSSWSWPVPSF